VRANSATGATIVPIITKAILPAAGLGTRLLPATKAQPKEMLPVGRKPTVQYVVEELAAGGVTQLLVISGQHKRALEDHLDIEPGDPGDLRKLLGPDWRPGIEIFYTRQSVPEGLARAIGLGEGFVGEESFIVALGDSILFSADGEPLLARMLCAHGERQAAATIAVEEVPREAVSSYGVVKPAAGQETDAIFDIVDLIEKPKPEEAPSNLSVAARYVFSPVIFEAIRNLTPGAGGEYQLTDAIRLLLAADLNVVGVRLGPKERRYDIGNFASYFRACFDFSLADPEIGEDFAAYARARLAKPGGPR
jgi:UTP--glucose-1-phosphate uridylyltransferase